MNPILGIVLIAIGSLGAASFYVPFKKVKIWSWESYWITHSIAAWLIAPLIFSYYTVPSGTLIDILRESPSSSKWLTIMFGALWGVGSLTFGLSIRYLGIALGQSISLGFCAAFGTIIPPIVAGVNLLGSAAGILTIIGVAICLSGIAIIGYAGLLKDKNISEEERNKAVKEFALKRGVIISVISGIMSASMSFAIEAGAPIAEIAREYGTNLLYSNNPVMIFTLSGGFITNFIYCAYLNVKNKTGSDYFSVTFPVLLNNLFFTFLAGLLWYLTFHFWGMGRSQLPLDMVVYSWSILMAFTISFSNIWGIIFLNEWKFASNKNIFVLIVGIIVLILSTFVVSF
jgi:L-rhamnose-H+ transport protein